MTIKTSLLALAIATAMTGAFALAAPMTANADEPTSVSVETTAPLPTNEAPAPAAASVVTTAPMPTSDATEDATKAADAATAAATKAADKAVEAAATAKADKVVKPTAKPAKAVAKDTQPTLAAPATAPAGSVSKATIIAKLKAAGYSDINELTFENAVWHAVAKDPKGKPASLTLAASDGHIILSMHG